MLTIQAYRKKSSINKRKHEEEIRKTTIGKGE